MSERLTDDELTVIEQRADELDASGVRTAHPWMRRAVAELRERRAADLSSDERLAIEDARDFISDSDIDEWNVNYGGSKLAALAVLDKLLAGKEG